MPIRVLLVLVLVPALLAACDGGRASSFGGADAARSDGLSVPDDARAPDADAAPLADAKAPPVDADAPSDAVAADDAAVTGNDAGPDAVAAPDAATVVDAAAAPDAGPACTPVAFAPPGPASEWRHTSTSLVTVTQGAASHRGQDVVVVEGTGPLLVGKFAYGAFDKDLEDEEVEVFLQLDPPCGAWVSYGTVLSSEDGQYGTQYGIEDDGGRVFFALPGGDALPVGRYPVRMLVHGDLSRAAFTLFVVPARTSTVVFDIDGTLTTSDFQLIAELFLDIFNGDYVPELRPGGPDVVRAWAGRGYLVVYLTGRPDMLRARSEEWLVGQGFPPGAVHLTDTNAQALPTSGGVAAYKTDFLAKLRAEADVDLFAAYGNATTDIEAYAAAGIPLERTFVIGDNAGEGGTVALDSYPAHLPAAQAMPAATVAAPPADSWW